MSTLTPRDVLVIKLGTQVVVDESGAAVAKERLRAIVSEAATLRSEGVAVLVVSSGAVGLGRKALKLSGALSLSQKQACAAVGQTLLIDTYRELLLPFALVPAQVLVTAADFSDRERYLNLRETFETLLALPAVLPIINENDVVSAAGLRENEERSFDDNDKLAALVAAKMSAKLLVLLTNVAGVYSANPATDSSAQIIREITHLSKLKEIDAAGSSKLGRGGMSSKLNAAKIAALCGVETVITSGDGAAPVHDGIAHRCGTHIHSAGKLSQKKQWIGFSMLPRFPLGFEVVDVYIHNVTQRYFQVESYLGQR